ncbi:unnamed protein product [Soboliphyme baturini]|uniref:FAT domain-containing protein n=1 Tax=Soboliphyme baturini TaxID=241478 RepID=A0A183ITP8_9BILA|nr:unnamed protein product [Soboliphyme baturini]
MLESLCSLYSSLNESDLWYFICLQRLENHDLIAALSLEQDGRYSQAAEGYDAVMISQRKEINKGRYTERSFKELRLCEERWIHCLKELGEWNHLHEVSSKKSFGDPLLHLETSWRTWNWTSLKDTLQQLEISCPKDFSWKANLYRGYLYMYSPEDQQSGSINVVVDLCNKQLIKEWRRLPPVVSISHMPILQASQLVVELQEAASLLTAFTSNGSQRNFANDLKPVIKTWRNRPPVINDDLYYWNQLIGWRLHNFEQIVDMLGNEPVWFYQQAQQILLCTHAISRCLLQFAQTAKKRGDCVLAFDTLQRLHAVPSLPVYDIYQKVRQQIKCCIKSALYNRKPSTTPEYLHQGLDVIDNCNISLFPKDYIAEFYSLKGNILSQLCRCEEARKAFQTCLQLNDGCVHGWAQFGEHLENLFLKERHFSDAVQALVCFLQAAKLSTESKSRKYIVKVMWLLKFDCDNVMHEHLLTYGLTMPPGNWVFWIPQLLSHLYEYHKTAVVTLLKYISRTYPEIVFYYTKAMARDISASYEAQGVVPTDDVYLQEILTEIETGHSSLYTVLTNIHRELCNEFRETWIEKAIHLAHSMLQYCRRYAFEHRNDMDDSLLPTYLRSQLTKIYDLVSFDNDLLIKVENIFGNVDFAPYASRNITPVTEMLSRLCRRLETYYFDLPHSSFLPDYSLYLSFYSSRVAQINIPGESLFARVRDSHNFMLCGRSFLFYVIYCRYTFGLL